MSKGKAIAKALISVPNTATTTKAVQAVKSADTLAVTKTASGTYSVTPISIEKTSSNTITTINRASTGTSAYTNPVTKLQNVSAAIQDTTTTASKTSKITSLSTTAPAKVASDAGTVKFADASTTVGTKVSTSTTPAKVLESVDSPNVAKLERAAVMADAGKIIDDAASASKKSSVLSKAGTALKVTGIAGVGAILGTVFFGSGGSMSPTPDIIDGTPYYQDEYGDIKYETQDFAGVNDALSFLQDQINTIADVISDVIGKLFGGEEGGGENPIMDIPIIGDILEALKELFGFGDGGGAGGAGSGGISLTIPGTDIKIPAALVVGLVIVAAIIAFAVLKKNGGKSGKKTEKKTNKRGKK